MAKVPLTTDGVQMKATELFALDQLDLDVEAYALATDFREWIDTNFELSTDELEYLESADEDFIRMISSVVFVCVRNRLPIDFAKSPITLAAKRFETKATFDFDYQWGGTVEKATDVKLDVVYL